ncbi:hypothetical protein DYB37_006502 [Aphanomyces astaci]|uniref:Uncharacterized protein n=1 Tax=Aphanomyces astaci TaxID=112090 RepID=A0A397EY08_APHAT|nr:hypothetical protein DYB25_003520 [Aphanomyces astaci]RHY14711.1 hypothetical protein DYB36_006980 [Aphanomyces astaci]RHY38958.1 hypothetical protein DYB30_000862 [Aphanomyces astaci]RHY51436.1 hypothetical protein DYB38_001029 [Aphanomyces astaci]RHY87352.1 hypothetical protein DYB35_007599 [Aphanomyces astaci]
MTELQTCRYSHGKCKQPRATKKNGTMHTLCEFHRTKACAHQKKLDAKRRDEKLRLLENKKSMKQHRHPDIHLWKEDENRIPMMGAADKFKPVWETSDNAAGLYSTYIGSVGHHHNLQHHPPPQTHISQQHTPRSDLYDSGGGGGAYDDHQQRYKYSATQGGSTSSSTLLSRTSTESPLGRRDDSSRPPPFPSRADATAGGFPSYASPTTYSTYTESAVYDRDNHHLPPRMLHHGPHMTTFDTRYDYYEDAPSPAAGYPSRPTSALTFGQYPPQPVYHQ